MVILERKLVPQDPALCLRKLIQVKKKELCLICCRQKWGLGVVEKGFWLSFSPLPVNYHFLSPSAPHYLFFNGCKTLHGIPSWLSVLCLSILSIVGKIIFLKQRVLLYKNSFRNSLPVETHTDTRSSPKPASCLLCISYTNYF